MQSVAYGHSIKTVFPKVASTMLPSRSSGHVTPSRSSTMKPTEAALSAMFEDEEMVLHRLNTIDFRYLRFVLDPRTGLYSLIRYVERF